MFSWRYGQVQALVPRHCKPRTPLLGDLSSFLHALRSNSISYSSTSLQTATERTQYVLDPMMRVAVVSKSAG